MNSVKLLMATLCIGAVSTPAKSEKSDGHREKHIANRTLNFRWLNNAGFEIVLPGGAHVLIDPWLDSAEFHPVSLAQIACADYILLSHIHADHVADIRRIQQKFPDVRIFVGSLSAEPFAKAYNLDTSKLYKVSDGQEFRFDDVTIKSFAGRHTESKSGNYLTWDQQGNLTQASWGTLDLYQYLITDRDGTKFLVWGGTPSVDNAYRLKGLRPDIAVVHLSPKQDFAVLARIISAIEPKIVMPHHYDIWPTILRNKPAEAVQFPAEVQPVEPDTVIGKMMPFAEKKLRNGGMTARYFTPDHNRWYRYIRKGHAIIPIPSPDEGTGSPKG